MDILEKYRDELRVIDNHEYMPGESMAIRNTPISLKANYIRLLKRNNPMFVPTDNDIMTLIPKAIPDNVARGYTLDIELEPGERGGKDFFGVEWEYVEAVMGSMVRGGSPKVPDITRWEEYITFPDIDSIDWEESARLNKPMRNEYFPTCVTILTGLFERLISLVDFEDALLAIYLEDQKEAVHRLFDRLCGFYDDLIDRYRTHYDADIICFHDDWGSQRAPLFSPETCREMLEPYLKRIVSSIHSRGMFISLHCCGKVESLVPVMISAGVDMWTGQPINDYDMLYKKFGKDIIFNICVRHVGESTDDAEAISAAMEFVEKYSRVPGVTATLEDAFSPVHKDLFNYIYCLTREAFMSNLTEDV
jgi:hypothetical protein